jgi:hypothetical protein
MIHALASHLWQSTLFAGAAALLTPAFRANKAQVRYCLWLSASVKFLIPFALLTSLGNHIQTWAPSPAREIATATPALSYTVDRFSQPLFPRGPLPVPASSTRPDRIDPALPACGYAASCVLHCFDCSGGGAFSSLSARAFLQISPLPLKFAYLQACWSRR